MNTTKIIPLVLALVGILGAQTANAHTWRYNAGYLQVVQDIALKGTHTSEFLDGYQTGMNHKGYVEAYSNMPMSSTDVMRIAICQCHSKIVKEYLEKNNDVMTAEYFPKGSCECNRRMLETRKR